MSRFRNILEWLFVIIGFWIMIWVIISAAIIVVHLVYNLLF